MRARPLRITTFLAIRMKQFLKYTLATIVGLFLFSFLSMFFMLIMLAGIVAASDSSSDAKIAPHSVYCIDMKGTVSERSSEDEYETALLEAFGQEAQKQYGLNDLLANIRTAKDDPNIDGIYLRGGALAMGPATADVLRRALVDFRESGKFIVAYADTYGQNSYYLASCADHLYVNADGAVDWHGMAANLEFYPRLLKKLGVEMQIVKVGTFKSAVEPFILTGMSDANRLQYSVLLGDIWSEKLAAVAASRGMSVDSLNRLADRYMALQPQADYVTTGLVDSLCYAQDVDSVLIALTGSEDYELVTSQRLASPALRSTGSEIAVIYAEGDITDDSGDGIVGKDMVPLIDDLADDDDVKAVVLRVNSGGGSAYASEQIHHALTLLKGRKPLVVSMGDYAASGGYYISCPADYIYAEPTTLTGSIGIFGMIPSFAGTADMVGLDFDGVKTNEHADLENNMVLKGMSADERALMQAEINRGYELFTRRCAEGRGIPQDSIKLIGEGRVWSGTRALAIGLVDSLGGIDEAICKAAQLAELDDYTVAEYPEEEDMLTRLINALGTTASVVFPQLRAERAIRARFGNEVYDALLRYEQIGATSRIQARLPYELTIR